MMPTTVLADNEPYVVFSDDNTTLTFFYDDQKASRNGLDLNKDSWASANEQIISVIFDNSFANCTTITSTSRWFFGFKNLTSITGLANLKTDNVTDMSFMFTSCSSLTSLNISGFKTDKVTSMVMMFYGCSGLTSLDVSGFKTDMVKDMHDMFSLCRGLAGLNLGGFKTDNVTDMSNMFSYCNSLTSLDVSGFKTDNVTNMEWMFYGCSNLETLDVSGFNTGNVTDMNNMFSGCSNLTSLDVSGFKTDNVTDMRFMFNGCSSLKSLDVSGFKTDNVSDMGGMFSQCRGLTSLDVSGFNTEKVTSVVRMFFYCESLKSLDISGFKTDKVNNMTSMFEGCSGLSSLNLVGVKTENVNDMTEMFYHCRNLKILDISEFKTDKVNNMRFMFSDCNNLETIYAGDGWSTTKVTDSEHMFGGCDNLIGGLGTKYDYNHVDYSYACIDGGPSNPGYFSLVGTRRLTISSTGNGSVTYDNNVISNQTSYFSVEANASAILTLTPDKNNTLKSLVVNGEDVISNVVENQYTVSNISANTTVEVEFKVENEPYAVLSDDNTKLSFYYDDQKAIRNGFEVNYNNWFNHRGEITKIVFDASFANYKNIKNTDNWFAGCVYLTEISGIENLKTDSVTNMSYMFDSCNSLTSLDVSGFKTDKVTDMNNMFHGCSGLTSLDVSGFKTDKVTNMSYMFDGCSNMTSLNVSGLNNGNVTNMSFMFRYCSNLTSLDISGFKTDKVKDMDWMFGGCYSLTSLDVSGFKTDNVKKMSYMFCGCSALTSLDVSGFVTDNVTDMNNMFSGCSALTSLDVSGFMTNNVTDMNNMFCGCSSLTGLDISGFDTENVTNMSAMFDRCSHLTGLDVSSFKTDKVKDMSSMFYENSELKTIYSDSSWNIMNVTRSDNMFYDCKNLVGGEGTKYSYSHNDCTYAHIDGGTTNPGYFTDAKYAPSSFAIKMKVAGNGSVSCGDVSLRDSTYTLYIKKGETVTLKFNPEEGFPLNGVTIDNGTISAEYMPMVSNNQLVLNNVSENLSIDVYFYCALSIKASGNGSVFYSDTSIRDSTAIFRTAYGNNPSFKIVPDEKFQVKSLTINNKDVTSQISDNIYTIDYDTDRIKGNTYIEVEFEAITYTLSIKAVGNGSVSYGEVSVRGETSTFSVAEGASAVVKLIPDDAYLVKSLKVNNEDVTSGITDSIYTINNINSNIDIEAIFAIVGTISNSGFNYKVVSEDEKTVVLSKGDYGLYINIPSTFNAYNIEWTVTGIEQGALEDASELAAIIWNPEIKLEEKISNPNLLLYVKSADYAPDDIKNVIVNNIAKSITLTDAESGNNFYCPQEFTAEKISYVHNYSMKTGYNTCQGWESIVLPFNVAMITNNSGIALVPHSKWTYGDSKRPFWLYSMSENGWNAEPAIKANKPYIISMPNNENYDEEYNLSGDIVFSASDIKVAVSDDISSSKSGHRYLVPNYLNQEKNSEIYALNVNNLWDKNTESDMAEGSAFVRGLRQVRPFEAYMTIDSGGAATRSISIFGDGNATGIESLPMINNGKSGNIKVYTLSGVLIKQGTDESVTEGLPKGVYIINNRKVVVD